MEGASRISEMPWPISLLGHRERVDDLSPDVLDGDQDDWARHSSYNVPELISDIAKGEELALTGTESALL